MGEAMSTVAMIGGFKEDESVGTSTSRYCAPVKATNEYDAYKYIFETMFFSTG